MQMSLVAGPLTRPVSLQEAKDHCRVSGDEENSLIEGYLDAAVSHLDGYRGTLGRCLITQDWRLDLPYLPQVLQLPFPDATVTTAVFSGESDPIAWLPHESLAPVVWRAAAGWGRPASITIRAGFGPTPADVPAALRTAILLMVSHWYDNRAAGELPASAEALISPFRMRRV